jgi:Spy/CpxP family protein refolding chaperone
MSQQPISTSSTSNSLHTSASPGSAPVRRFAALAFGVGVLSLLGVGVGEVSAHGPGGHGMGPRHRFERGASRPSGPASPEQMAERLERGVEFALDKVDATDEQKERVTAIVTAAAEDLRALREEKKDRRDEMRAAIVALDRAKVEALRQENLTVTDRASRRFTDALLEAGAVLTAEQREELAELLDERRERREHFFRGRRGGLFGR